MLSANNTVTLEDFDRALAEARQGTIRTDQGFDDLTARLLQTIASGQLVDERIVAKIRGQLDPLLP